MMLEEQIARAKAALPQDEGEDQGLQKAEGEKVSLNLMPAAPPGTNGSSEAGPSKQSPPANGVDGHATNGDTKPSISLGFGSISTKPPAANVFKSASSNVFKQKRERDDDDSASTAPRDSKKYVSESERLMKEDQARRAARQAGYVGQGPKREDHKRKSNF